MIWLYIYIFFLISFCIIGYYKTLNIVACALQLLFSRPAVSDSLWPHGLQHARFPCPLLCPWVCSNSVHWVNDAIQPTHPLSPFSCPQSFPASGSFPMSRPEYWSFSFSISPSNEYSWLISFRIDCFYLLSVQGTLKSLPQHQSSKTSILIQ